MPDPRELGLDARPITLGSWNLAQENWVLKQVPLGLSHNTDILVDVERRTQDILVLTMDLLSMVLNVGPKRIGSMQDPLALGPDPGPKRIGSENGRITMGPNAGPQYLTLG